MSRHLRGDAFVNRYRITGTLTTAAPLHIGTGESEPGEPDDKGNQARVAQIVRDAHGKPMIPGSALKGVMRHWLLQVLKGIDGNWATERTYDDGELNKDGDIQAQQAEQARDVFSWLELLFGTPWHAGKIDVWDSRCISSQDPAKVAEDALAQWDANRLTYVETSVAIDPLKGTAANNLLYSSEVVPAGVTFGVNIAGQNLSEMEIGMVLLALQGFNSEIWPVTLGAKSGRGYGRMRFAASDIYRLSSDDLQSWIDTTLASYGQDSDQSLGAGFYGLDKLTQEEAGALQSAALEAFANETGADHV